MQAIGVFKPEEALMLWTGHHSSGAIPAARGRWYAGAVCPTGCPSMPAYAATIGKERR